MKWIEATLPKDLAQMKMLPLPHKRYARAYMNYGSLCIIPGKVFAKSL